MTYIIAETMPESPLSETLKQRLVIALKEDANIGAEAIFNGICRDENGKLAALELEHYPAMADKKLRAIAQEAANRWDCKAIGLQHRYGRVLPQETIVSVIALSSHRSDALNVVNFIMDFLKTDAPFWKKEILIDGTQNWVNAKPSDDEARKKWQP